ncbi:MAG: GGDEF domain-containing protein [Deltaproteobacteria bacterium]|nr:GGDEF domain-containing protein [Deltaproteobacteria bacterium]
MTSKIDTSGDAVPGYLRVAETLRTRFGVVRGSLVVGLGATLASVAISFLLYALFAPETFNQPIAIVAPILVPALVATPICGLFLAVSRIIARDHAKLVNANQLLELEVARRSQIEEKLRRLAQQDSLTGLANRRCFFEQARNAVAHAQRFGTSLAVLMIDADEFKSINDLHGHEVGDEVLRFLADTIDSIVREVDLLARIGGEEFAVLISHATAQDASILAERLRELVAKAVIATEDERFSVTVSIGVADYVKGDADILPTLRRADEALFRAKAQGRNRVCLQAL